jgi:hypothetical protein
MLKIASEKDVNEIHVNEMKDGDVAVIISWSSHEYVGRVVQRYGNYLLVLGANSGLGWGETFSSPRPLRPECRVRILPKGTLLEV